MTEHRHLISILFFSVDSSFEHRQEIHAIILDFHDYFPKIHTEIRTESATLGARKISVVEGRSSTLYAVSFSALRTWVIENLKRKLHHHFVILTTGFGMHFPHVKPSNSTTLPCISP